MSTHFSSLIGIEYNSLSDIIFTRAVEITFSPTFSASPLSSLNLPYQQVWNFGDGTYSYDTSPSHIFYEQGIFPVTYTVFLPNSATTGIIDEIKTITTFVSVFNYINDSIEWSDGTASTFQSLQQDTPFTISLSSSNIENQPSVQLYARGSRSQPWQSPQEKWSHLKPQWRFTNLSGDVIDNITPGDFTTITIDSSGNRTFDGSGTVVGTSATFQCYYIDDIPTQDLDNIVNSVTLVASLITSGYNVEEGNLKYVPSFINSGLFDTTNHVIKYLFPDHLKITTNGITPLNDIIWENAYTPYTITVHPSAPNDDIILKNFPQSNFLIGNFVQSLSNIPISSVDFADDNLVLSRFDVNGFDTGGYARSSFIPLVSSDNTAIVASMSAIFTFFNQSFGAWVSNPYFNQVMFLTIDSNYTGIQFVSTGYIIPNSQVYGIARVTGNVDDNVWMTDPTNDKVYYATRSFGVENTIDLRSTPQLSAYAISSNNSLTPAGICLDSMNNVWITLFDAVSTIKLDGITGNIINSATPPGSSYFVTSPGISGFGGEQLFTPTKVDSDTFDNIWVAYNNPLSSFLCKYDTNGNFLTKVNLPNFSKPYDLIVDHNDNIWVTLSYTVDSLSGSVAKYDSNGTLVHTVSTFKAPSYITLDFEQNPWFIHGYNYVTQISATNYSTTTFLMSSDTIVPDPSANIFRWGLFDQELAGISCDWFDQIWVLNSYDNRIYRITTNHSLSSINTPIQITPFIDDFHYSLQAYGDWQGVQWFNKFSPTPLSALDVTTILHLSGTSNPISIINFADFYDIRKINEDFDGVNKIRDITLQNNIKINDILYNTVIAPIAGTLDNDPLTLGTAVYEKISNFITNQADIDTCNAYQLYSLHQLIDLPIDDYRFNYPSDIKRILDLLSISLSKLKPTRSKFAKDFKKYNAANSGVNIGKLLDTATYIVSAGVDIVANIKFSTYYERIQTMPIDTDVLLVPQLSAYYSTYPLSAFPLTSYPLSAFYGWGLNIPVGDSYFFYEYLSGFNNNQVEGVIDWGNAHTTLTESISSVDEWYKDGGIVDSIFDYYIFKGLGLIDE